jgi:hypothetical protein
LDTAIDPELRAALKAAPTAEQFPNNDYARLLDLGKVTVSADGSVTAEYRMTYKLFNERARSIAEVTLPYNSSYQTVELIRARTITKIGKVLTVKPEDTYTVSPYNDFPLYDDSVALGFSMPGIENDCVIDYSFRMVTQAALMPGNYWEHWGFTSPCPVGLSRFSLSVPAAKPIHIKVHNDETLQPTLVSSKDGKRKTYTWTMKNLPPIDLEPMMPPLNEIGVWLEATSLDSWEGIARWFWSLERPQEAGSTAMRQTVNQLIAGKTSEEEKARAIYDWVAQRVRYVGLEFGESAYQPHKASQVYEKLYGDCKDKAILLVTMLRMAGIKAQPVLLRAASAPGLGLHTKDRLPGLNAFNHCIAKASIGGKPVWLDSTAESCLFGDIPAGDRGADAFVVGEDSGAFETIPAYGADQNRVDSHLKVKVQPDGSAEMDALLEFKGETEQAFRMIIRNLTPDKRKELAQRLALSIATGAKLNGFQVPSDTDRSSPYTLHLQLTAPNWAKKSGKLMIFPVGVATTGGKESSQVRLFVKESRKWPIVIEGDFLSSGEAAITLPEGYGIEDMPGEIALEAPLWSYHRTVAKSPDGRTLSLTNTLRMSAGRISTADYGPVKSLYDSAIKSNEEPVVLRQTQE